jgi:hypothetical protein
MATELESMRPNSEVGTPCAFLIRAAAPCAQSSSLSILIILPPLHLDRASQDANLLNPLPISLFQTYQSVSTEYWSAPSPEFMQTEVMQFLRWMRMSRNTVFAIGAVAFVSFAVNLIFRP